MGGVQDDVLVMVARRFHVISDVTRLRLLLALEALEEHEACVQELADQLDVEHKTASRALNLLYDDGLLSRRRAGGMTVYALHDHSVCQVIDFARKGVAARIEELSELITS